jgi:hypothetical protein
MEGSARFNCAKDLEEVAVAGAGANVECMVLLLLVVGFWEAGCELESHFF